MEERLKQLFRDWMEGRLAEAGRAELMEIVADPQAKVFLEALVAGAMEVAGEARLEPDRADRIFEAIVKPKAAAPVRRMNVWVRRAMAAAAVLLFLVFSYWFFVARDKGGDTPVAVTPQEQDVEAPKDTRAVITLADGRKVLLDSLTAMTEAGAVVTRDAEGAVSYELRAVSTTEIAYNTLSNPRGSKVVSLTLSDGTKVWLNAESSLRYPVAFTGSARGVEITGEAYFEVEHDAAKPFIVSVNDMQVEVLGTEFNINSYSDEAAMKTTLLEGKVRITSKGNIAILKPGQQAIINSGQLAISSDVDTEAVMAWKNGYFHFAGASLQEVMRQIGRWYDVEVVYQGRVADRRFGGEISRSSNLSQVLKILEESKIHFSIEDKKLIVKP